VPTLPNNANTAMGPRVETEAILRRCPEPPPSGVAPAPLLCTGLAYSLNPPAIAATVGCLRVQRTADEKQLTQRFGF
jgi:hypothetical protein